MVRQHTYASQLIAMVQHPELLAATRGTRQCVVPGSTPGLVLLNQALLAHVCCMARAELSHNLNAPILQARIAVNILAHALVGLPQMLLEALLRMLADTHVPPACGVTQKDVTDGCCARLSQ